MSNVCICWHPIWQQLQQTMICQLDNNGPNIIEARFLRTSSYYFYPWGCICILVLFACLDRCFHHVHAGFHVLFLVSFSTVHIALCTGWFGIRMCFSSNKNSIYWRFRNFRFYPSIITSTGLVRAYDSLETEKWFKEKRRKKKDRKKKEENWKKKFRAIRSRLEKIEEIKRKLEKEIWRRKIKEYWRKKSAEFFLNKEKEKVMKTKEKLCQTKQLFLRNLLVDTLSYCTYPVLSFSYRHVRT